MDIDEIIIYDTYSRITHVINSSSEKININQSDLNNIFIIDSNGKLVNFKYEEKDNDPLENLFKKKFEERMVNVYKGPANHSGNLIKYDNDSVTISTGRKIVKIVNYDTIEVMSIIKNNSTISFKENGDYALPYYLSYITSDIYWKSNGIGLISKKEKPFQQNENNFGIYDINLKLRAQIYNQNVSKNYKIYLSSTGNQYFTKEFPNSRMPSNSDFFEFYLGTKTITNGVNIFEMINVNVESKKYYFHTIGDDKAYLGFRISNLEKIPNCQITFYEYDKKIGKLYGISYLSQNEYSKFTDIYFGVSNLLEAKSTIVEKEETKNLIQLNFTNKSNEILPIIVKYFLRNKIFSSISCLNENAYVIYKDHIEVRFILEKSDINLDCEINFA